MNDTRPTLPLIGMNGQLEARNVKEQRRRARQIATLLGRDAHEMRALARVRTVRIAGAGVGGVEQSEHVSNVCEHRGRGRGRGCRWRRGQRRQCWWRQR
jgi:hypothetical protein